MKSPGIKSLFLASALLISGAAKTDAASKPIKAKSSFDSTFVEKNSAVDKAPIGVLYIHGPEFKETPERIALAKETIRLFNKAFSEVPHEVVGDGENDVSQEDIKNALKKLGQESKSIGMIVGMHGSTRMVPWLNDHPHEDEALWMENKMVNSTSSQEIFTSQHFYTDIGNFLHEDSDLINVPINVIHQSCHGNAALISFTELPVGSTVLSLSPIDDVSSNHMEKTFEHFQKLKAGIQTDGSKWALNQETFMLGILHATDKGYGPYEERNHPFLIKIDKEEPESINIVYNQIDKERLHHAHEETIGRHGGTITDLKFIANNLLALHGVEEIDHAVEQHQLPSINRKQEDILIKMVLNNRDCEDISTAYSRDDAGMLYMMAYTLDKTYARTRQPLSTYIKDHKMIVPVKVSAPTTSQTPNFRLKF